MASAEKSDLPEHLAAPARRALANAGVIRLEQLARFREAEVLSWHGMGPNAADQLRAALATRGMSFAKR